MPDTPASVSRPASPPSAAARAEPRRAAHRGRAEALAPSGNADGPSWTRGWWLVPALLLGCGLWGALAYAIIHLVL